MSASTSQEECGYHMTIEDLPPELLRRIFDFLSARFVIKTLSQVSKSFHHLINDDVSWRIRIARRWPNKYPIIPVDNFDWKTACIEREEQHNLWSAWKASMDHLMCQNGLYASVDAVHLMKNGTLLASGSRDRYLNILDLTKLRPNDPQSVKEARVHSEMKAHKGWIWSITSLDNMLLTSSWDTYMAFWDMADSFKCTQRIKCKSAILCTHFEENFLVAGGYDKKVYQVDPRMGTVMSEKRYHKKPVLCLAVDDDYIITGSEDQSIVVYDRRKCDVFKRITTEQFTMSMSYGSDQMWVGDKTGLVHLYDTRHGEFSLADTFDVGHTGKLTGIRHSVGSVITCSTDKTIKVWEPSANPGVITTLAEHWGEVAGIDYQNNVLVSAGSDVAIGIWKPKTDCD